jgi:P-type Ca2+ transporter type 2C
VLGLKDEVRTDSKKTIKECTQAGIRVMMLTGDSQGSALNVAHDVDLFIGLPEDESTLIHNHKYASSAAEYFARFGLAPGKKHDGVVTNTIPEDRREDFYASVCTELKLLYEASAEDKLLIVNTLQSQNHTVGYVGDGNNDSKAMSHADVGFSMGGIGT